MGVSVTTIEWFDFFYPTHPPGNLYLKGFDIMEDLFCIQGKDELLGQDSPQCFAMTILDAKYELTDIAEAVDKLLHLNAHQKSDLFQVQHDNEKMFDGTLKGYP